MATWNIGDKIQNRWEIQKILGGAGKSGMGIVYVVYDHEWKQTMAAKTFQRELLARNPKAAQRFKQEALAWVNLDAHPNVVQAHFVETIEGQPLLFLEYLSGGDLSQWMSVPRLTGDMGAFLRLLGSSLRILPAAQRPAHPPSLPDVLRLAVEFCDGMDHVLSKGIVAHRDIKPANCLLTEQKRLKVTDFGLSKVFEDADVASGMGDVCAQDVSGSLSLTGQMAGTPPYMAPEQFVDAKHVDLRADIYAFGVMLFQMVTGRLPFTAQTLPEWRRQHQEQPPPHLEDGGWVLGYFMEDLDKLIQHCLAKAPEQRPLGFGVLRKDLARLYCRITHTFSFLEFPRPAKAGKLNAAGLINKGISLHRLGRNNEALAALDNALRIDPRSTIAWDDKALVLSNLGRNEEALAACEAALQINHRHLSAWLTKGNILRALGRKEEALAASEAALELNPQDYAAWITKGNALSELGRKEEALAAYETSLKLNPRSEVAWTNQGLALSSLGRREEALAAHESAVRINPRFAQGWFNKGALLLNELGRHAQALACFKQAGNLGHPKAGNAMASCLKGLPKPGGLLPYPARSPRTPPLPAIPEPAEAQKPPVAPKALPRQNMVATNGNHWQQALSACEMALKLNPQDEKAWSEKGFLLNELGRKDEALAAYEAVLRINPRLDGAWFRKGVLLLDGFRRPAEALPSFQQAKKLGHPQADQMVSLCQDRSRRSRRWWRW